MRYTTEYNPALTQECKNYISSNINPIYSSEDTDIYSLNYVCEVLKLEMEEGNEEVIFNLPSKDMEVLQNLTNEKVNYIEF
jgi:hypothetical protein